MEVVYQALISFEVVCRVKDRNNFAVNTSTTNNLINNLSGIEHLKNFNYLVYKIFCRITENIQPSVKQFWSS